MSGAGGTDVFVSFVRACVRACVRVCATETWAITKSRQDGLCGRYTRLLRKAINITRQIDNYTWKHQRSQKKTDTGEPNLPGTAPEVKTL